MKEMGWSWQELCETPERVFLDILRIISLKNKEELKIQKEIEQKMKRNIS